MKLVSYKGFLFHPDLAAILTNIERESGQDLSRYITSAYRNNEEQKALYKRYTDSGKDNRYLAAKPGTSDHEFGLAVDVIPAGQRILRKYGPKHGLLWLGAKDRPHFYIRRSHDESSGPAAADIAQAAAKVSAGPLGALTFPSEFMKTFEQFKSPGDRAVAYIDNAIVQPIKGTLEYILLVGLGLALLVVTFRSAR